MSRMTYFVVRDSDGTVIDQCKRHEPPEQPDSWGSEWNVEEVDEEALNSDPVKWWVDQSE